MFGMIYLINQVGGRIWIPFQLGAFKLGWFWEAIFILLILVIVIVGSSRIAILLPKADHGLFLPQADCGG